MFAEMTLHETAPINDLAVTAEPGSTSLTQPYFIFSLLGKRYDESTVTAAALSVPQNVGQCIVLLVHCVSLDALCYRKQ